MAEVAVEIRPLEPATWPAVERIYAEGIAGGHATFETTTPSWEAWDSSHLEGHRLVALQGYDIGGWAALSPISSRACYSGVAEDSVYVASEAQGRGIGTALLEQLVAGSELAGIWTLQCGIFPENEASLALHRRCGFRVVGVRAALAQHGGTWRDVVLMERRSAVIACSFVKVEAVVLRERVETVIDAVEEETGHVGVTVVEAIGHGRERGITHEYRGRVFESRFLPKAVLTFVVAAPVAAGVVKAIADAARSGNESGDGLVWTLPAENVMHNRTGRSLKEVDVG